MSARARRARWLASAGGAAPSTARRRRPDHAVKLTGFVFIAAVLGAPAYLLLGIPGAAAVLVMALLWLALG